MLFVTLHGGKPEKDPHKNNIHAYDKDGNRITSSVLDKSEDVNLNELRGLYLAGKYLYVANANKTQNSLLCYEGSGTHYRFLSRFASNHTCNGILHPFDFTFDGLGYCYLSSQDTNVVTRLMVSDDGRVGRPAPVAAALPLPEHSWLEPSCLPATATWPKLRLLRWRLRLAWRTRTLKPRSTQSAAWYGRTEDCTLLTSLLGP